MLKASIDIGSNSVLLLVGDVRDGKFELERESQARVTGLGKNLDESKRFNPQAAEDSFRALKEYRDIIANYRIDPGETIVTATETMRVATNAHEFYERVKKELGFRIIPITTEGEAYFTSLGVVANTKDLPSSIVIMDIGGASTELIKVAISPFSFEQSHSLPIGSVRATDFISAGTFDQRLEEMFSQFPLADYRADCVYCVAGTMTSLGAMSKNVTIFSEQAIDGIEMTFEDLVQLEREISQMSEENLLEKYPYLGKRAQTILGGCRVAKAFARTINARTLKISKSGLRYGTIVSEGVHERFRFRE